MILDNFNGWLLKDILNREIYHCPYCNLCRVGKGLGIDYFHCMNCNACMSRSLSVHVCREKCFMDNCPICHEDIFTSNSPVKALRCGHLMHSTCFQVHVMLHIYSLMKLYKYLNNLADSFDAIDRITLALTIPALYVVSPLETCRSVIVFMIN